MNALNKLQHCFSRCPSAAPVIGSDRSEWLITALVRSLLFVTLPLSANAQSNDFGTRTLLVGDNVVSATVNTAGGSRQPGEVIHPGADNETFWMEWVAPSNGRYTFSTVGSAIDTVLAIYVGNNVTTLQRFALNDNAAGSTAAQITATVSQGESYKIMVAPGSAANGNVRLTITRIGSWPAPTAAGANDYNQRPTLTGNLAYGRANSHSPADRQPNEPFHPAAETETLWWQWTAPANGSATISATGQSINGDELDTVLSVYVGAGIESLQRVRANDNAPATIGSSVTFPTIAGQAYQIMGGQGSTTNGDISIAVSFTAIAQPPALVGQSDFNLRPTLVDMIVLPIGTQALGVSETNRSRSGDDGRQPGEPVVPGSSTETVWWQWVAPANGEVIVDTSGSTQITNLPLDTVLAVYRGVTLNALTLISSNDDAGSLVTSRVTFIGERGVAYQIVAAPGATPNGNILLKLFQAIGPLFAITTQPQSQTVSAGAAVTVTVSATGSSLTYQWQFNGANIPGATGNSYTLASASAVNMGTYRVIVQIGSQSLTSNNATLTVLPPSPQAPVILAQPRSLSVPSGGIAAFVVDASGTGLSYQWQFNGANISGATGSSYILSSVSAVNMGVYRVLLQSGGQSLASSDATLTVLSQPTLPPVILAQPHPLTVPSGRSATFVVNASGNGLSYQWQFDGRDIIGATAATYTVTNVSGSGAGGYRVLITNAGGTVASNTVNLTVTGRLINLSVRTTAGTGNDTLVAGFSLSGGSKQLLIRGIGPTLAGFNVSNTLADPGLTLFQGQNQVASNDNWGGSTTLRNVFAGAGAFPLAAASLDAALYSRLDNGSYTAQVSGKTAATGVSLLEVYDTGGDDEARLVNLSARCQVGTGDNILTVGFFVMDGPITLLVRGIGPTLELFGVGGVLTDPKLQLFSGSTQVGENDNWDSSLAAAFASAGAFPLVPGTRDAALRVTLQPGAYTAQVSGANFSTGVGLVEVYELP